MARGAASGLALTVMDAGVVIGFLRPEDAHHDIATAALRELRAKDVPLVLNRVTYAEVIVRPSAVGEKAVAKVDAALRGLRVRLEALDQPTARAAARLRARHGNRLPLPDAIVVATAEVLGADVITTDGRWPPIHGARVRVLAA